MNDKNIFIDTNILIYRSFGNEEQKNTVHKILDAHKLNSIISTQVLSEFINAGVRKKFLDSEKKLTAALLHFIQNFQIAPIAPKTILQANDIRVQYKYSYYDSLIIATALENKCGILFSEDLQHNQIIRRKLKIINPFKQNT
jgi:predicted nucleic acid-binding protein